MQDPRSIGERRWRLLSCGTLCCNCCSKVTHSSKSAQIHSPNKSLEYMVQYFSMAINSQTCTGDVFNSIKLRWLGTLGKVASKWNFCEQLIRKHN